MFKPLTQLNQFFRLATDRKLSGSDQLMYLHLFNKFNQAHWTETLRIKDAELKESMRLFDMEGRPASVEILRRGRQRLKGRGFINFVSGGGREPEYSLIRLYPDDTPDDTPAGSGLVSYTAHAEDVKTDDYQCTGAEVNELDELMEYWERDLQGGRLAFEHLSELSLWLNQRGMDWVKEMMKEASDSNNNPHGLSFKFLKAIVSKKLKPKKTSESSKGGGKKKEVKDTLTKLDDLDY